ncbi:isopenicillin N synthase family dioxygenase [Variovorax sp. UC122_21]|uniref:isopenicillin N synthase family dioxygenase n=1 Tax=Variovorax sp. UC122_21 TaxID=3374554 RepID=UPI003757D098
MQNVPVIDVRPFLEGSAADKILVATQIRDACEQIGFFTIVGHGVPMASYENLRSQALAFFALPEEERMRTAQPASKISRGYSAHASRALAYSMGDTTPPDLQQSFAMGPVDGAPAAARGTPAETAFFMPNYWPEKPAALKAAYEDYYRRCSALATEVLRMFAVALDLDEHYFDGKVDQHTSTMRTILYPGQDTAPVEGQLRAGAHTDYGTLTIVRGDDVPGGLQVRIRSGEWVDVHPAPDSFVCNVGDLMMRWTNDRWLSNVHRVANPPPEFASVPRFSVAFFHNPNFDAEIRCIDANAPSKYEAVQFGAYYMGKHLKAQNMTKATA